MSNLLSLENFDRALQKKNWDLKKLADEYDKKYSDENGKTIYNTLRKWRSPNGNPTLNILVRICDLLECDIDYLLGRIEESTHTIKFIGEKTGLSEDSQKRLQEIMKTPQDGKEMIKILDKLIRNPAFSIFLIKDINRCYSKFDNLKLAENSLIYKIAKQKHTIKEEIKLKNSGDIVYDSFRQRLSDCHDSYDASLFRIQGDFGKLIDDLIQKYYHENNPYDM